MFETCLGAAGPSQTPFRHLSDTSQQLLRHVSDLAFKFDLRCARGVTVSKCYFDMFFARLSVTEFHFELVFKRFGGPEAHFGKLTGKCGDPLAIFPS